MKHSGSAEYVAFSDNKLVVREGDCGGAGRYHLNMSQATKVEKSAAEGRLTAIERTSGMFAHLAPGVSLADELVADRRAEVRAEEQADEAERRRRGRD